MTNMPRVGKPKPLPVDVEKLSNIPHTNQTVLLHTLSSLFPQGEKFFVQSVRHYRQKLNLPKHDVFEQDIARFIGQEAWHSQAHDKLNKAIYDNGVWNPERVEGLCLGLLFNFSPRLSLHVTAVLEHWTATLAKQLLSGTYALTEEEKALWYEHAREEIEHAHVSWELLCRTGNALTPLWSKLLFPVVSGTFLLTLACMYVKNGGRWDFQLLKKLAANVEELAGYMLPHYTP